jgi:hypothetical protein
VVQVWRRRVVMNKRKRSMLVSHLSGPRHETFNRGASLVWSLVVLGLLILALPAGSFAAAPKLVDSDMDRLASIVRFYTDRHERAANADSAEYRATAAYVRDVLFSEQFGGSDDPARWLAVARFLTDPDEQAAHARCCPYASLANSLRGLELASVESTAALAGQIP